MILIASGVSLVRTSSAAALFRLKANAIMTAKQSLGGQAQNMLTPCLIGVSLKMPYPHSTADKTSSSMVKWQLSEKKQTHTETMDSLKFP